MLIAHSDKYKKKRILYSLEYVKIVLKSDIISKHEYYKSAINLDLAKKVY